MAPLSEEEENYVRLALLLKGLTPRAVRTFFDNEFPPTYLPSTLNKNYNTLSNMRIRRVITTAQWNLLFPTNGVPDSKTFDVQLMISLIRNLTSVIQPINGFDRLPLAAETTPGPDLARIKWYRNKLAHHDSNTIDTHYFNTGWRDISDALRRLGGDTLYQESQELKMKILDQSNREIILEIQQSIEAIKEVRMTMDSLGLEHSKVTENLIELKYFHSSLQNKVMEEIKSLKDPISRNMKEHHQNMVQTWKCIDNKFAETNASRRLLSTFSQQDTNVVTITGPRGSGKSFLTHHIAIKMKEDYNFVIIPIDRIEQVIDWFDPESKQLFVLDIDNAFYDPSHLDRILRQWQNYSTGLQTKLNNESHKMIACCSTETYEHPEFEKIGLLRQHKFDLKADDNILSDKERETIATRYMKKDDVIALKGMMENLQKLDNFPMLCEKYDEKKHGNPTQYFSEYISIMNETRVEHSNTKEDNKTLTSMTSMTTIAQQTVDGMFTNTTFNNSPVTVNLTINTNSKN